MTTFESGSASLVGQVRSANEDSFLVTDDLVAVADGMGGHLAGEVASADTVEVLRSAAGSGSIEDLVAAVHRANRRINEKAAEDPHLRGMGTTVCVAGQVRYDDESQVAVLNVGDSRVYLFADGELEPLTEDHSLVGTLLREGRITAEEAERHPQRNVITRALGVEALVVVDAWLLSPCDGDRLLLCSDGLFGELSEDRIAEVLGEGDDPEVTARRLAAEADAAGGRDNITVVVVDLADTGAEAAPIDGRYRRISTPAVDLSDPDEDGPRTGTLMAVVVAPEPHDADDELADETDETDENDDTDETGGTGPGGPAEQDTGAGAGGSGDAEDLTGESPESAEPQESEDAPTIDAQSSPSVGSAAEDDRSGVEPGNQDSAVAESAGPQGSGLEDRGAIDRSRTRTWRTVLFVVAVVAVLAVVAGVLVISSRLNWVVAERDGVVVLLRGPKDGVLFLGPEEVERFDELRVEDLPESDRRRVEAGDTHGSYADARSYVERLERATTTTTSVPSTTTVPTTSTTVVPTTAAPPPPTGP